MTKQKRKLFYKRYLKKFTKTKLTSSEGFCWFNRTSRKYWKKVVLWEYNSCNKDFFESLSSVLYFRRVWGFFFASLFYKIKLKNSTILCNSNKNKGKDNQKYINKFPLLFIKTYQEKKSWNCKRIKTLY